MKSYCDFFVQATAKPAPYPYQERLAANPWPELLDIPTGLGKTAAVTLAWLWKRRVQADPDTPRRLIWCLPMRVLVEQTEREAITWLKNLGLYGEAGDGKVSVQVLMGGADDLKTWAEHPEEDMILIGTQDMLLSRALMRGYGMSRYLWPVHFAFLHNDALWVLDEVQLMGAGLPTTAQLEAFRRSLPLARPARTLWVSATLNQDWLATVDFRPHLETLKRESLDDAEHQLEAVQKRFRSVKRLHPSELVLSEDTAKTLTAELAQTVLAAHQAGSTTLVILNRVDRAQDLRQALAQLIHPAKGKGTPSEKQPNCLLLHARFRPAERRAIEAQLRNAPEREGRIVIATQAIEAGVDLTSRTLITELAPWSSLVQRFGRCNRHGELNDQGGADIYWINITGEKLALPYDLTDLDAARQKLAGLESAQSASLPRTDQAAPLWPVLRKRDFLELFNTDADLSGFDVDVAEYIRDNETPPLAVFWRDFGDDGPGEQAPPSRDELCPVSIGQARSEDIKKLRKWQWDTLARRWVELKYPAQPRPGMTLLFQVKAGGYDLELGFKADSAQPVTPLPPPATSPEENYGDDHRSRQQSPVLLADHLSAVQQAARDLCAALSEGNHVAPIILASLWHDVGKSHPAFQTMLLAAIANVEAEYQLWAKSTGKGRARYGVYVGDPPKLQERRQFRHELASMLAWLAHHGDDAGANLVAYLIAAHHGKVRMNLRALPDEIEAPDGRRYARGIWEGDGLPPLTFAGETLTETPLKLALMELGDGEQGASWTSRTQGLLAEHGPFALAWLESLVRVADWRGTRQEQTAPEGSHHE